MNVKWVRPGFFSPQGLKVEIIQGTFNYPLRSSDSYTRASDFWIYITFVKTMHRLKVMNRNFSCLARPYPSSPYDIIHISACRNHNFHYYHSLLELNNSFAEFNFSLQILERRHSEVI